MIWTIAVRNLFAHRTRTIMLAAAIIVVTSALTLMAGLSAGAQKNLIDGATVLATGHVNVSGFYKQHVDTTAAVITNASEVEALLRSQIPEVKKIYPRGRGLTKIIHRSAAILQAITAVDLKAEPEFGQTLQMRAGSMAGLAEPDTLVLFEDQAARLGVGIGDEVTLVAPTTRGVMNSVDVRIVGIARNMGFLSLIQVMLPLSTERKLHGLTGDMVGALQMYVDELGDVPAIREKVRTALLGKGYRMRQEEPRPFFEKLESVGREDWTGQKLDISIWEDEVSSSMWTLGVITVATVALTLVMLAIVAAGLMNSFLIAVRERTQEIGTLRAIGMKRSSVVAMLAIESGVLGFSASVLGSIVGFLLGKVINAAAFSIPDAVQMVLMSDHLSLEFGLASVVRNVLVVTFSIAGVALFPAFSASRISPIAAMVTE